jgi:ferrous iron transport protein B
MNSEDRATTTPQIKVPRRVVLIGMPNTGKSTLFNRLTRASAAVGNWPGMTVALLQAQVEMAGEVIEFVDLPGIYDLNGFSDDEAVVQQFLANFAIDLVVVVLNAAQIDRQIHLLWQVRALNLPMVALLNMADEAKAYGVKISVETLSQRLGLPILLISAKYGLGCEAAWAAIGQALQTVPVAAMPSRADLRPQAGAADASIQALLAETVTMPTGGQRTLTSRLDSLLLHPILGLPLFFLGMFLAFWLIWTVGLPSQDGMGWLTDGLKTMVLSPLVSPLPSFLQGLLLDGVWNGLATVASFVPLILLFFVLMAVLEDSGYLSRSAYLMDSFMERLGLDGRSFVLQMLGFGCNVPALMGTRVMRSHPLRLLTMLIIPFSLCSARLQVFVFILAAIFPDQRGAIALFSLYLLSFIVALVTALLFQKTFQHEEPFVLELPPYRWPTLRQVVFRSWLEVREFVTRASGFILLGCVTLWLVTNLPPGTSGLDSIGGQIGQTLRPVMQPLGINPQLTLALLFGFVAKEVVVGSLAVIYGLQSAGVSSTLANQLTWVEGYSFCIFCLLYTPCLATLATLLNESRSWKFTLFSLVFSLLLAWVSSFVFYQSALRLGLQ